VVNRPLTVVPAKAGTHFDFAWVCEKQKIKMDYSPLLRAALPAMEVHEGFSDGL